MHPGAQRGWRQARHIDHLAVRWAAQDCWSYTRSHVLRSKGDCGGGGRILEHSLKKENNSQDRHSLY
jgi:hypothetical protein